MSHQCIQARAAADDGPESVRRTGLRPTHTPAVLITRGRIDQQLGKIACLARKAFRLLIAVPAIGDERRRERLRSDGCAVTVSTGCPSLTDSLGRYLRTARILYPACSLYCPGRFRRAPHTWVELACTCRRRVAFGNWSMTGASSSRATAEGGSRPSAARSPSSESQCPDRRARPDRATGGTWRDSREGPAERGVGPSGAPRVPPRSQQTVQHHHQRR
ncbi:DUF5958 family protein [Streptomyces sp. NBC_00057]|uniref:DUF5958 family protein n=1 Tax=Streptomyces sp. NBC_00057 TaxID=2975634 RepID=UPI0032453460